MPSRRWRLSGRLEPRAEVVSRLKWEASVIIVHSLRTLPKAPQAEPIEAQRRLDDPKDRFDGLLAQGVEFAPGFGRQPVRHHRGGAGCGLGGGWVGPFFERCKSRCPRAPRRCFPITGLVAASVGSSCSLSLGASVTVWLTIRRPPYSPPPPRWLTRAALRSSNPTASS